MKDKIIAFFTDVVKEMNKVTWPKKDDLRDSTVIVLVVCLIIAAFVYVVDAAVSPPAAADPVTTEGDDVLDKKWYVVRTYSGHENKVKAYLENEVAAGRISARRSPRVIVPSEKVFEVKDGKKKSKTRTFFPGYILVEAVLDKETHASDPEYPVGDQLRRTRRTRPPRCSLRKSGG